MKQTIDHNILSSVYLWVDNVFTEKAEGHFAYTGTLKNVGANYLFPYRQLVYDSSIPNTTVCSGVYSNGTFTSGNVDYLRGVAYGRSGTISGVASVKEVNTYVVSRSDQQVLFDSRFVPNPKTVVNFTGYQASDYVYPCALIKTQAGKNQTIAFEGGTSTIFPTRITVLADTDSMYKTIVGYLRDKAETYIPLFSSSQLPFDVSGRLRTPFDYSASGTLLGANASNLLYVKEVIVSDFSEMVNSAINPNVIGGFVDLKLESLRFPRA